VQLLKVLLCGLSLLGPRTALCHVWPTSNGSRYRAAPPPQCKPKLNEPQDPEYWLSQPGAPKPKLENEKPKGQTVSYNELIKSWEKEN